MNDIFDNQARPETGLKTALQIFLITLILSVAVLYYYFGPTISEIRGNKPQASANATPITLIIGQETFVVPENYTQFPRARRGGVRENVALYALMPGFEPFAPNKREVFERHEAGSPVIHFQLESYRAPLSEEEQFQRVFLREVVDRNGRPGPFGLTLYEFKDQSGYRNEELYTFREADGELVVIRCYKVTETIQNPSCRRDLRLLPNVALSYRYRRPYLENWRSIDDGVRKLSLSFHRPASLIE